MAMRAIPKELLPHSAGYRAYLGNGRNGGQWDDEITLKNICIDCKSSYRIKNDVQSVVNGARLMQGLYITAKAAGGYGLRELRRLISTNGLELLQRLLERVCKGV